MTFHERTHVRHFVATFVRALTVFVVLPIVGRGFRARVSLFRGFTHRMLRISSTHETPLLASRTSKGLWNLALETRDLQHEWTHEFLIFVKLTTIYIYIKLNEGQQWKTTEYLIQKGQIYRWYRSICSSYLKQNINWRIVINNLSV